MKNIWIYLLPFLITVIITLAVQNKAFAKKPDWAGEDWNPANPQPVSAPGPVTLTLIGMGASGAVGYYLGKRKK